MKHNVPRIPFSTGLSGSVKETELRIRNIMSGPKKRPPALFLALIFSVCLFCGNLVSCQVTEPEVPASSEPPAVSNSVQPEDIAQPEPSGPIPPAAVEPAAARAAYVRVLEDLLYRSTTPDGTDQWSGNMEENTFAVADVDGDGREELILLTRPIVYAGYRGYVLDYDTDLGRMHTQFDGFPSLTFYTNGALAEDDSHAQGSWNICL